MWDVGVSFRAAGVSAIYVVHGTFVGPDALGVASQLARVSPAAGRAVRQLVKRAIDRLTGDVGNYTEDFIRLFESSINGHGTRKIPVRRFHWSSENHHIGRADGAVRLIDELAKHRPPPGQRILLWGHSHAGNLFALATNLLSGDREAIRRFFRAAEIYYRWPVIGCVDIPVWDRVRELLDRQPTALADVPLDIVTFGTPIQYGWDSAGYSRLLHFVNHSPVEGLPEYQASFPPRAESVLAAADGDYVQQLGIAGSNLTPSIFAWRSWLADRRLGRLLQSDLHDGGLVERLRAGVIVPDEGTTLLVDYPPSDDTIIKHHAGHAIYTQRQWLLFHAEQVAARLYPAESRRVA